jgi:methylglyoxal synthase
MAEHFEKSAGVDRVRTLVYLTDPKDLEESYPEDIAMFRSAMRNDVLYLPTFRGASHWAAHEADGAHLAERSDARPWPPRSGSERVERTDPERETLALIAHDGKKLDLCKWVVEHTSRLRRFDRFVTTGTTGGWVAKFLTANGVPKGKIAALYRLQSGPSGGDIEIAGEILRGNIENAVFFVDPMTSHPHEADIQAFLRICAMPGVKVNLRLTEFAATSWIRTVEPAV